MSLSESSSHPSRRQFLSTAVVASAAIVTPSFGTHMMQANRSSFSAKLRVRADEAMADGATRISRHIYGQFAEHLGRCIYDGIWVKPESKIPNINGYRKDVVEALKAIKIPNLRWPGGCFADDYHWRDGIGPRDARPRTVNIHWGNYVEDNSFGTHEFMDLCELLECDAYVALNVGSGTPAQMRAWLEYMTFEEDSTLVRERKKNGRENAWRLPFVGIGNENWGCGGDMTPEFYSNLYNQFAVYARNFGRNKLTKVACGVNAEDYNWAEVVLEKGRHLQALSWHYYSLDGPWSKKGGALDGDEGAWHRLLHAGVKLDEILSKANAIWEKKDPQNKVDIFFDEWGTWHRTEQGDTALYQQNTIRDAVLASASLDIFHRHAKRVKMTNIAQVVNVLQAMILTEAPGGKDRMVLTPTYHVFDLYKVHHDAMHAPVDLDVPTYDLEGRSIPSLSATASVDDKKTLHVSLTNLHSSKRADLSIDLKGISASKVTGRLLTAEALNAHNTFEQPENVKLVDFNDVKIEGGVLKVQLPPRSVATLTVA
jgi:alpha-L-arabinofuranosidase